MLIQLALVSPASPLNRLIETVGKAGATPVKNRVTWPGTAQTKRKEKRHSMLATAPTGEMEEKGTLQDQSDLQRLTMKLPKLGMTKHHNKEKAPSPQKFERCYRMYQKKSDLNSSKTCRIFKNEVQDSV